MEDLRKEQEQQNRHHQQNPRDGRLSGIEDAIEEIDMSVKENVRSKTFLTQNIQEIWDIVKRPNLRIMGIRR